jgi:hypothetical protein
MPAVLSVRTNEAVRLIIETWVGLLVEKRYEEALAMLVLPRSLLDAPEDGRPWTPELLATVIRN